MTKLALFDCDGTLVDSQGGIIASMAAAFGREGLVAPAAHAVRRVVGLPLEEAIRRLAASDDDALIERLDDHYRDVFSTIRLEDGFHEPMFEGIDAAVAELDAAGVLLGVATGKGTRGLTMTLERHGLLPRFMTLQTSDTAPGKPHPDMALQALAETGVEPQDAVMIGDTVYDVAMAKAAGLKATIGVSWGYHEADELREAGAARIASSPRELPALVAELLD
ncbi:HAD-IA family hydrolase [Roseiterribacter gracilis]|uniref:Hydrolase n=1 Tax=Roseiterribacter gracilis TaxID=2812848 RepID=A0A8S8X8I6_9PROT|nr:hydrolase [Rhodospirillales bacterium TMPK1]